MEKFKLHIDPKHYSQKPAGNEIAGIKSRLQKGAVPSIVSLEELADKISHGHSISPAVMSGMSTADWQEQQLFLVDIDNECDEMLARRKGCTVDKLLPDERTPILSVENALNICKEQQLPVAFYYHTFSSSNKKPKFRLGFVMGQPVKIPMERYRIIQTLVSLFPQSDKSCINADRIFLGTNSEVVICDSKARITMDTINHAFPQPEMQSTQKSENSPAETYDTELEELKRNFDFLSFLKERNGECKLTTKGATFKNCEICGHHDNLAYYSNDNTFYCFSDNGNIGGSIIDYLIKVENLSVSQAIDKFKYELCGLEKPYSKRLLKYFQKIEPEKSCSYNDKDYSKLFSKVYKNKCRFNSSINEWMYFNGKVWELDDKGMKVRQKAKTFASTLLVYAPHIKDEQRRTSFLQYVTKLGQNKFRETLIRDARDVFCITNNDLDTKSSILNCLNGTLDLSTLELKPHNANDLLSRITNVIYNPKATCPIFTKFIKEIMDDNTEKIDYLQRIFGYALTSETNLETCFICYGKTTRNGKSTLLETISFMLGNSSGYAMNLQPLSLAQKQNRDSRQASGDIARLRGCRFVTVSEFPRNMILDVALLKQLTGRDTLTAREMYQKEFEFIPCCKLFLNTNTLPMVNDETLFDSNRVNVITFDRHFEPDEQDKLLKDKLLKPHELSGILNWCIQGLKKYRNNGAKPPTPIIKATQEYELYSNKIALFFSECVQDSNKHIKIKDLYQAYALWCGKSKYAVERKGVFTEQIKRLGLFSATGRINGRTEQNVVRNKELKADYL